jgi:tetratricopeptide (TPR) repeat protein
MKNIIYLILFTIYGHAASLTLNEAKDDNKSFSILHIKDNEDFSCEVKMRSDFKDIVICLFSENITPVIYKSNKDFSIESVGNELRIIPRGKMILESLQDDFITTDTIKTDITRNHKHWIIIGYNKEIKLFRQSEREGIDFDIIYQNKGLPFVGSLDLDGLPIVQKSDAIGMRQIREAYKEKDYERVIKFADDLLENRDKVFSEEAGLYKLRAMDKLAWQDGSNSNIDTDDLLETAKEWMQNNPSSKYLPEVLMYISKMYYKLGHMGKGDEYSDILKEEFYDSKYNKIAQIHKADRVYKNRKRRAEAIKIYKEVLYNTDDLDIASLAASKISKKYLDNNKIDLAVDFYKKVINANEAYIKEHPKESYEFAKKFAEAEQYDLSIQIVSLLLGDKQKKDKKDEMYKDIAYWYELSGDKKVAYGLYKQYLKDYPRGEYVGFVKSRLDRVLLDVGEKNVTKKMENINNILTNYPNDPVYKKALIEKAQILSQERNFNELFAMEEELKKYGGYKLLKYGAEKKISDDLKNDNCKDAIYLAQEYNATIGPEYEMKYFECLIRTASYQKALDIAKVHLKERELPTRLEWMYLALKAYSKLDQNKKVILLAEDIEKLSKIVKTDKYNDIVYSKAEAYYNLREYNELMLSEVRKAEKFFPKDIRNIDLFMKVLRFAKNGKNDLLIVNYAKKIIQLQREHKINHYSPLVELDYINALKRLKQYDKALKEDLKLLYVKLTDKQRANVLYIAGELSLKMDKEKEAKEFFIKCGEIIEDSAWQKLCAQSLELLDE